MVKVIIKKMVLIIKFTLFHILFLLTAWLQELTVQKLVVVIKRVDTNEVVERWQFDIECDKTADAKT
jgi:mitotic spindle assembly checkpoint protein MAD2